MSADASAVRERIDPSRVLSSLGYTDVTEPTRVTGGWDTLLWRFATPEGSLHTLRVLPMEGREEFAWRERLAFEACARAGLPAPRLESAGEYEGMPALVLSWCPGRPLLSQVERKPWAMWRLGRLFGRAQARVHAVSPPEEMIVSAPDDWLTRLDDEYHDLAEHGRTLAPVTSSLIHMDFHPLNLVTDGKTVTGILDWSRAAAGDPRADLARTEITLLTAPVPPGPAAALMNLARRLILRAWRSGYREEAGAVPEFEVWRAWAGATLLAEALQVIGQPGVWGTAEDMERLKGFIARWAREAGIR